MTTEPTMVEPTKTRAFQIFEGVFKFFQLRLIRQPPAALTRDQHINAFIKGLKCNCNAGSCGSCQHRIKDVFGE
jgi:hypothetical protein